MIFGALAVLLILFSIAGLVIPLFRQPRLDEGVGREQQNISIARDKQQVLMQQLDDGVMTQEEFDAGMLDIETSLAIDLERQQSIQSNQDAGKWASWLFIIAVPVLSVYLYALLGSYQVIDNPDLAKPRQQAQAGHGTGGEMPSIEEMIEKLKNHLRENTDDASGWFMLARTYMTMERYDEAVVALERSLELKPEEPAILLALADTLAMTNNGDMTGRPEKLVLKVLDAMPLDPTALWLAGLAAEQGGRHRDAFDHWMKLLPLLTDDPDSTREVKNLLTALKQKNPELPELDFAGPAIESMGVALEVMLDDSLRDKVQGNELLFIYARAAEGPPMPLAAKRLNVADLPLQLLLTDDDAMTPQMKLSSFDRIVVGARISLSGDPVGRPGDLYAESEAFEHKGNEAVVSLNIDKVKQ